ncbi:hypothetical protein CHARACLAT_014234 [Characodon lateralis]|uniref:Uncharacterized protein n=1 Tax=Characodon lateralis TaxID=208331 RepID=A0ABU7CY74_9TELE|nr:hypothetical protein [Characodon lateralis]
MTDGGRLGRMRTEEQKRRNDRRRRRSQEQKQAKQEGTAAHNSTASIPGAAAHTDHTPPNSQPRSTTSPGQHPNAQSA